MSERCEFYREPPSEAAAKTALYAECTLGFGCHAYRATKPEECMRYWRERAKKAEAEAAGLRRELDAWVKVQGRALAQEGEV